MDIKMREIGTDRNVNATVQDLIHAYEECDINIFKNKEEKTYQWNNFVKEFRNDRLSKKIQTINEGRIHFMEKGQRFRAIKNYSRNVIYKYEKDLYTYLKE